MLDSEETALNVCGYFRISDSLVPSYLTSIPNALHARLGSWGKLAILPGGAHALYRTPGQVRQ